MPAPLIGLSTSQYDHLHTIPIQAVSNSYIDAVYQAGGLPVLVPVGLGDAQQEELLDRLQGLVFTGGSDLDPAIYAGAAHPRVYGIDRDRDLQEIALQQKAIQRGMPFLGICRGCQMLNVALGGTLYSDVTDQHPGAIKHDYYPNVPRTHLAHPVQVVAGTHLASIIGAGEVAVNSIHHQGCQQVADGLVVSACAPDGLVEGLELPNHPFGVAVQWHPEWLQAYAPMRALFQAFVIAAKQYSQP